MMDWSRLITNKRLGQEARHTERHDDRTEFKRDYDRLIFSAPFRRLQNKTQVFPLPGSVFVHNRLTHSLEVASVGMSLGSDVARALTLRRPELADTLFQEIGQIVATACLAHDMGNPPFGHSGEKAIQTFFTEGKGAYVRDLVDETLWSDLIHFEGNANALRLLTHQFEGRRPGGFVMTYSTLASVVKYPYPSLLAGPKGKFGFFAAEYPTYCKIADEMGIFCTADPVTGLRRFARHPLVYLVEAADDICYEIMDLEDAHKLKLLSTGEVMELFLGFFEPEVRRRILARIAEEHIDDANERIVYLRASVIGLLENECVRAFVANEDAILSGTFEGALIDRVGDNVRQAYRRCAEVSAERVYRSKPVLDIELSGYKIMQTLMEQLVDAAVHPDKYYSQQLISRFSNQYEIRSPELSTRLMATIDYISGMTDVYALDYYQKISGISLPIV